MAEPPEFITELQRIAQQHLDLGTRIYTLAQDFAKSRGIRLSSVQQITSVGEALLPTSHYTSHEWVVPSEPIGANQQKFTFSDPITMLIFYGEEDMQIEVDNNVSPSTPVIPRYIMGNFEMSVNYVTYKLSPQYASSGARTPNPKLNLFGFRK